MIILDELLKRGFQSCKYDDYDCVMRIHEIHYLFWSENLNHFAIGVKNVDGKKEPGGYFKEYNIIVIPKPIYQMFDALLMIEALRS